MSLRQNLGQNSRLLLAGLFFLVLATAANVFLPRWLSLSESLTDGSLGILYGIAIGLLSLSLYLDARTSPATAPPAKKLGQS